MIGVLANLLVVGYALVCVVAGGYGLVFAPRELDEIFAVTFGAGQAGHAADFFAQYRFLKAMEIAFGVFILLYRRDILDGKQAFLIFAVGCGLGCVARLGGWFVDGTPSTFFALVVIYEIITLFVATAYSRRAPDSA